MVLSVVCACGGGILLLLLMRVLVAAVIEPDDKDDADMDPPKSAGRGIALPVEIDGAGYAEEGPGGGE